jgi:predicted dinucleotide-utilizing enzyme
MFEKNWKKLKKGVDREKRVCYSIKAVADTVKQIPWQINSNATLKILREINILKKKYCVELFREQKPLNKK